MIGVTFKGTKALLDGAEAERVCDKLTAPLLRMKVVLTSLRYMIRFLNFLLMDLLLVTAILFFEMSVFLKHPEIGLGVALLEQ